MVNAHIELEIPPRLKSALKNPQFYEKPVSDFIKRSALDLQSKAITNAPVGVSGGGGGLRGSIVVDLARDGFSAAIGSKLNYAPHVEYGTKPHWPPWRDRNKGLGLWARRRGMSAFLVARAIARRGTKPQRYMQRAIDSTRDNFIPGELKRLAGAIERAWVKLG